MISGNLDRFSGPGAVNLTIPGPVLDFRILVGVGKWAW